MTESVRRLFISHASSDKPFVNRLIKRLEENGVGGTWYDVRDIDAASDVYAAIDAGIAGCDYFAIVLSPAAATRQWVSYEITKARESGKQVLAIQYATTAEFAEMLLGNPHINLLLTGGHQKALNFLDDFDGAFLDLLCQLAPDIGSRQLVQFHLKKIVHTDDPDEAERIMSQIALKPKEYLPDLFLLLPDLRNTRKLQYRVGRAMCHIGRPALAPLMDILTLNIRIPGGNQPVPPHLAGKLDKAGADEEVPFFGSEALDYLRHIIVSGGNRDWAAQLGASYCLGAMGNHDADVRAEVSGAISDYLKSALGEIPAARNARIDDRAYDRLRMVLDVASQITRGGNIDPWLVHELASEGLWGSNAEEAIGKLGSYIVAFFSNAKDPRSLKYLLQFARNSVMVNEYFSGMRVPNPWEDCFIPFGAAAIEPLIENFSKADPGFQRVILQNLASISNPHATGWVLDYLLADGKSLPDSFRGELLIRMANSRVPSTATRIIETYLANHAVLQVAADERERIDTAAAAACQWTQDKVLAIRACTVLLGGDCEWWVQLRAAMAVGQLGLYALYGAVHELVRQSKRGELRSRCAYELARHKAISEAELKQYLANAAPKGEAPMFAAALSYYDVPEAIPHLVRGLQESFSGYDAHMHDFYADALRRMTLLASKAELAKWNSRI